VWLLTSYVGLLPCASTIRRAATFIIIAAVKGEAQYIIKGRGARASFMAHPLYIHYINISSTRQLVMRLYSHETDAFTQRKNRMDMESKF
jgi:hypothetical protein